MWIGESSTTFSWTCRPGPATHNSRSPRRCTSAPRSSSPRRRKWRWAIRCAARPDVRVGLDTLYGGGFPAAAAYFAKLAGRDSTDPAPVTFEASAYIWWAAALENDAYEAVRIDSLLDLAIARAHATSPGPAH